MIIKKFIEDDDAKINEADIEEFCVWFTFTDLQIGENEDIDSFPHSGETSNSVRRPC